MQLFVVTLLLLQFACWQARAEVCLEGNMDRGTVSYPGCDLFGSFERHFSKFGLARPSSEHAALGTSVTGSPLIEYRYQSTAIGSTWDSGAKLREESWPKSVQAFQKILTERMCERRGIRSFVRSGGEVDFRFDLCVVNATSGEGIRFCRPDVEEAIVITLNSCEAN